MPGAVDVLIKHGADVNQCTREGISALMFAAHGGYKSYKSIISLLNAGADLHALDENGKNCLDYADPKDELDYIFRNYGLTRKRVEYSGDNQKDIIAAILNDDLDKVKSMADDVDINEPISWKNSYKWPLIEAIEMRRFDIAKYLLEVVPDLKAYEANLRELGARYDGLLQCACKAGRVNMVKLLLGKGVNAQRNGRSELVYSLKSHFYDQFSEQEEIVSLMLKHHAQYEEAFLEAIALGDMNIIDLFVDSGVLEEIVDKGEITKKAVFYRNLPFIKKYSGWIQENYSDVGSLRASLNYSSSPENDLLELECRVEVVLATIKGGADINEYKQDDYYCCPLNNLIRDIVKIGDLSKPMSKLLVKLLDAFLEAGAIPEKDYPDSEPSLIMWLQGKRGMEPIIEKILAHGSDINRVVELDDNWGPYHALFDDIGCSFMGKVTALKLSAANGYLNYVKLFIENGADPHHDEDGTALEHAESNGRKRVAKYLRELEEVAK
jgi:ankyrin repeat protein